MKSLSRRTLLSTAVGGYLASWLPGWAQAKAPDTEWRNYAGDSANTRYAPLDQIHAGNFNDLEVAWRFKAGSLGPYPEYFEQCTPLVVKGRLYATAGSRRAAVCLNAATGEILWKHSEDEGARADASPRKYSGRGVAYWTDGNDERILYVTTGYRLIALDAHTGAPVRSFGVAGIVDLKENDDQIIDLVNGQVGLHATPIVAKNIVIVGAAHPAGDAPKSSFGVKGYVRGFDIRTGEQKWIFHTIPRKGELGYDTWIKAGDAERADNTGCWGQISVDLELNTAYLPIELPTGDQVGIYRQGPALFGESIVAVDIDTGRRKWHYQLIHHGLWDRDIPCAPILCDIPHEGKIVKALAQPTKQAFLYVLNRETGEPVWPIPETPVPAGDVPGEWYSPTQPIPSKPPAYGVQEVNSDTIIDFTPELHAKGLEFISHFRTGGVFNPPTLATADGNRGSLCAPSLLGGTNWPGGCYDPETHKVYVFAQNSVAVLGIVPGDPKETDFKYVHGTPSAKRLTGQNTLGGGPRPASVTPDGLTTIDGLPLLKPPYGTLSAIDLSNGDITWQVAHGDTPDYIKNHPALKGLKIPRTGRTGILGPTVTKTLLICGEAGFGSSPQGVRGAMLRAYDKATGEERGAVYMPGPQTGAPMTYMLDGRQYIVLGIGGDHSAELIAFRLPRI
jgi:quinoprotein glucose dehydrogenase